MKPRYLVPCIKQDLTEKMVFLSGPRQCGKTTLALSLLNGDETHAAYFNWDHPADRKKLIALEFPAHQKLLIFDELHKYKNWRNWLKGVFDKTKSTRQYLITGSARLDYYKRSGDALTGRFHHLRLHPLSLNEIDPNCHSQSLENLMQFGGFPEPHFKQSTRSLKRWQRERMQQVMQEDLRDLERVQEISLIELVVDRLPQLVGSPLSINALREDLNTAHQTVTKWLVILERLFVHFRIYPYGAPKIRAVKKEAKLYMWDWATVPELGFRFENLVASHLLKYCHFYEDTEGDTMELRYLRDTDGREVDFVVLKNKKPLFAVECKLQDTAISPALKYFAERTPIPQFFQVHAGTKDFLEAKHNIRVLPFATFCKEMGLV